MRDPVNVSIYCDNCGSEMGFQPVAQLKKSHLCLDPACRFLPPPTLDQCRDTMIASLYLDGVSASNIAMGFGLSRQRIYQIVGR